MMNNIADKLTDDMIDKMSDSLDKLYDILLVAIYANGILSNELLIQGKSYEDIINDAILLNQIAMTKVNNIGD